MVSKAELFNVMKQLSNNETPGKDGLPVEFYKIFFEDICDLLLASYNFSFNSGTLTVSQRNGVITLIPKKDKDPLYIKNFRPITLLTTDYKLIAKVIGERLKKVLSYLIDKDQQGFMKGRNISHNIRTIIDIIEYANFEDIDGSIVLLDLEKAFDRVEHKYLLDTLELFNLGDNFLQWIKTFYNARSCTVVNNGFMTKHFPMSRGIFQGCPISPLLFFFFLLAVEPLAISIRNNIMIKRYHC